MGYQSNYIVIQESRGMGYYSNFNYMYIVIQEEWVIIATLTTCTLLYKRNGYIVIQEEWVIIVTTIFESRGMGSYSNNNIIYRSAEYDYYIIKSGLKLLHFTKILPTIAT